MEFQTFDQEYLERLRDGNSQVEQHFAAYFGELIHLKVRRRVRSPQLLEDIRQETLLRVLRAVRENRELDYIPAVSVAPKPAAKSRSARFVPVAK